MEKLLPIGSVVKLNRSDQKLMVCGRYQMLVNGDRMYDYSGCLWPQGVLNSDTFYLFDQQDIKCLYYEGYKCEEEIEYSQFIEEELGKIGE